MMPLLDLAPWWHSEHSDEDCWLRESYISNLRRRLRIESVADKFASSLELYSKLKSIKRDMTRLIDGDLSQEPKIPIKRSPTGYRRCVRLSWTLTVRASQPLIDCLWFDRCLERCVINLAEYAKFQRESKQVFSTRWMLEETLHQHWL